MLTSSLLFSVSFVLSTVHSAGSPLAIASQFSKVEIALQKGLQQLTNQAAGSSIQQKLAEHHGFYPVELMATIPDDHRGSGR